ncbi:MAG TPA: ribosome biogenesis factor YjgA, partial [Gammaproteobacteria bacterium]|nr:ribosome biogenesis factor YjgA [Gammaproteobacteria bacterium]
MPQADDQLPDHESKSQRKRDMLALQELGRILTTFSEIQLDKVPISDAFKEIIRTYRTLKTHESKRRHMQYIGKKIRAEDTDAIKKAIENIQMDNALQVNKFHDIEQWRDKLIAEGD